MYFYDELDERYSMEKYAAAVAPMLRYAGGGGLAGGIAGGVGGYMYDDGEDQMRNALIGAGAGAGLGALSGYGIRRFRGRGGVSAPKTVDAAPQLTGGGNLMLGTGRGNSGNIVTRDTIARQNSINHRQAMADENLVRINNSRAAAANIDPTSPTMNALKTNQQIAKKKQEIAPIVEAVNRGEAMYINGQTADKARAAFANSPEGLGYARQQKINAQKRALKIEADAVARGDAMPLYGKAADSARAAYADDMLRQQIMNEYSRMHLGF